MPTISQIKVGPTTYDIKDSLAIGLLGDHEYEARSNSDQTFTLHGPINSINQTHILSPEIGLDFTNLNCITADYIDDIPFENSNTQMLNGIGTPTDILFLCSGHMYASFTDNIEHSCELQVCRSNSHVTTNGSTFYNSSQFNQDWKRGSILGVFGWGLHISLSYQLHQKISDLSTMYFYLGVRGTNNKEIRVNQKDLNVQLLIFGHD